MKVRVNKKWWQFWLPDNIDIGMLDDIVWSLVYDRMAQEMLKRQPWANPPQSDPDPTAPAAIEADEAEPWWGGDAMEDEDSSVVTAEPPIVYANRGNARMEERKQARAKMQ